MLFAAVAAPVLGLIALAWRERWGRVRDDMVLFLRVLRRPRLRERLADRRRQLVTEFEGILAERDEEVPGSGAVPGL